MIGLVIFFCAIGLAACETTVTISPETLIEGCTAEVTCDGGDGATYTWKSDIGGNLEAYKSGNPPAAVAKATFTTAVLTAAMNTKKFECSATVAGSTATTADKAMTIVANGVADAKPSVETPETIEAGKEIDLTCTSPGGSPDACTGMTSKWWSIDAKDVATEVTENITDDKLKITVKADETLKYKCQTVINSVPSADSEVKEVKVKAGKGKGNGTRTTNSMIVLVFAVVTGYLMKM